jgi:GntR family transcriptional repressor for pyruvate dehydrogenase complex
MTTRSSSIVKQIAHELQRRIQAGDWASAGKLPGQRELATELGVSRASLREAVILLEGLGLLRSEPGRGVFIARPGEKGLGSAYGRWVFHERYALQDVYLVRSRLEELAVMLAAKAVTSSGIARLQATVTQMQLAAVNGDLVTMSEGDQAFHTCLMELAGSTLLHDLLASIEDVIEGSRRVAFANPDRVEEPIAEHQRIIDALAQGDAEQAKLAMRSHINNVADRSGVRLPELHTPADHPAALAAPPTSGASKPALN